MKIILVGPPGVGKGSQAELLQKHFNISHISTGDMFRYNLKNNTKLGQEARKYMDKGMLVPDSVTNEMVKERLGQSDCQRGFILDGYPRNSFQAETLDTYLELYNYKLDAVILLVSDDETLINRITGRRVCHICGAVYHVQTKKPQKQGKCDVCQNDLIQRVDDNVQTVKTRLNIYHEQANQLISHYAKQGLIIKIDGTRPIEEGFNEIVTKLGELK